MRYEVKADVGGKLAQLGGRLIDATAKRLADEFFEKFSAVVGGPAAQQSAPPPPSSPKKEGWFRRLFRKKKQAASPT